MYFINETDSSLQLSIAWKIIIMLSKQLMYLHVFGKIMAFSFFSEYRQNGI
jgi:hypothetical protein